MKNPFDNKEEHNILGLTFYEYSSFQIRYKKAAQMAMDVIEYIWFKYGLILSSHDLAEIENLLPKVTDFKAWDKDKYIDQLLLISTNLEERAKKYKEYMSTLARTETEENILIKSFPFYQEYIEEDS